MSQRGHQDWTLCNVILLPCSICCLLAIEPVQRSVCRDQKHQADTLSRKLSTSVRSLLAAESTAVDALSTVWAEPCVSATAPATNPRSATTFLVTAAALAT